MKKIDCEFEGIKTWVIAFELIQTLVQKHIIDTVEMVMWDDSYYKLFVRGTKKDEKE